MKNQVGYRRYKGKGMGMGFQRFWFLALSVEKVPFIRLIFDRNVLSLRLYHNMRLVAVAVGDIPAI